MEHWGPSFEIRFRIKVQSFDGQVLLLSTNRDTVDGVPMVEAINQRMEVTTSFGLKKETFETRKLETGIWYHVEIHQKKSKINPDKVPKINKQLSFLSSKVLVALSNSD